MIYNQYQNATNLKNLLDGLYPYITINVDDFFRDYFDITTCNDKGLNNWGIILNISRTIELPESPTAFGFGYPYPDPTSDIGYPQNFNGNTEFPYRSNFFSATTKAYDLPIEYYRTLLKFKYKYLTTNMSILSANLIMNYYTQSQSVPKKCIVTTTTAMNMDFNFNYVLDQIETAIFYLPNVLPVPTGVISTITSSTF